MSETAAKPASSATRITECPIRAFEHHLERSDLPAVPRSAVVGELVRGPRSLEEANRAVSVARINGAFAQVRTDQLYLLESDHSAETLLALLEEYLETTDDVDQDVVGQINARRQQLRNGGGPGE